MRFILFTLMALLVQVSAFAQGVQAAAPQRDDGLTQTLIMVGIAIVFGYLILFRPEQKRRKEMEAMRDNLKKGDLVTAVGIRGVVSKVQDDTVVLRMVEGAKIEFLKSAITEVHPGKEEVTEKTEA